MKLKSLILATCLGTAIAAGSAFAGTTGHEHGVNPAQRAEQLQKSLQLSDQQRQKVQQLFEKNLQQRDALAKKYTIAEHEKFRTDLRQLHENGKKELDALLTAPQRTALEAQHAQHERHGMHGKRGHDGKHRGDRRSAPCEKPAEKAAQPSA